MGGMSVFSVKFLFKAIANYIPCLVLGDASKGHQNIKHTSPRKDRKW